MHATLNRVYKVIWCKVRLAWVAVSEVASGCGKVQSSTRRNNREVADAAPAQATGLQALLQAASSQLVPLRQRVQHALAQTPSTQDCWGMAFTALALATGGAMAAPPVPAPTQLPTQGQVAAGLASIVQNANTLTVNQASNRAIINWSSFNVGSQATVNFVQPSPSSVALNRVLQSDPSQIYGQINANGQVYLVNPAGIYFAPGASVNVGGIVATTHQMADADFLAGKTSFERNGATGSVVNEGSIQAGLGGYIAMLAPEVRNSGVLVAQSGTVALAAGERITLNFAAANGGQSKLDSLTVTAAQLDTLVENRQAVRAPNGLIILSAQAASQLSASVVNSGTLDARGVSQVGGRIVLDAGSGTATGAGAGASIIHSGRISVDSDSAQGGQVTVTGDSIRLGVGSSISASGPTGGGAVLVGGDWQGSGNLRQATTVGMEAGASIDASATAQGNGGKVVLWSNVSLPGSLTQVDGSIRAVSAGSGAASGASTVAGGQVETSGHQLGIGTNASVVAGAKGQWLLDPADITISTGANSNLSINGGSFTPNSSAASTVINVSSITGALNSGTNVSVSTFNNGTAGSGSGDITVSNAINWSGTGNLTLFANRNLALNANIVASGQGAGFWGKANGNISAGAGSLQFQTNNGSLVFWSNVNGGTAGGIAMNQNGLTFNTANGSTSQTSGGGDIIFAGGNTLDANNNPTGAAVSSGYGISFNPALTGNNLTRIYSGGGNITMNASSTGSVGLYFWQATTINAGNGSVNIRAQSANSRGIEFNAGGGATDGTLITGQGISLTGISDSGSNVPALAIANNFANITATGAGNVNITGTAAGSVGLELTAPNKVNITTASGNISLSGSSTGTTALNYYYGNVQSTGGGSISLTANSTAWAGMYQHGVVNYSTTTGNISIVANGAGAYHALQLGGGNITTTSGNVLLQGRQTGNQTGVYFAAATNVTTAGGAIVVNGSASVLHGVYTTSDLNLTVSQGTGGITINGTSGSSNYGMAFQSTAVNLTTASGDISLNGSAGGSAIEYYAGNIRSTAGGSILINANSTGWAGFFQPHTLNFSTTSGNINIVANGAGGYHGMTLGGGNITTTSGNVLLKGAAAGTEKGVYVIGLTNVTTVGGNITVNGTGATQAGIQLDAGLNLDTSQGGGSITVCGTSNNYLGVYVSDVNTVTLTAKSASGAINITGTAGDDNQGVFIYKGNISSSTGAISLSGTSGTGTGLEVNQLATNITSTSGNITLTGRTTSGTWGMSYIGTEISSAGNISFVSDATMRVNANVYSKGAGNPLVFKSNGGIWNTQTQTIQTNNGSLVFWANANGSTIGRVVFDNEVATLNTANGSISQTSGGGKLIMGGGTAIDASGYPTGAAQWNGDWAISFGGGSSGYGVINTGGGDISIRGNAAAGSGIMIDRTTSINAGNGNITLAGGGSTTGAAIYLNAYNGAYNITAAGDITLQGIGGAYGIRAYYDSTTQGGTIRSTGGNVTLTGNGTSEGVYLYSTNTVVADVGSITVTGNSATRGIVANGQFLAGAGNITLSSPLSKIWLTATVGQLAGSVVPTSSTNISVSATSLFDGQGPTFNTAGNVSLTSTDWNLGTVNIGSSGNVSILPLTSAGFSGATYLSKFQINPTINGVSYTPQSLTIGNATSSSTSVVYLDSNITVNGAISVIGGGVNVSQNLTSNTGNIWLQGTSSSADVTFSNQKIWAKANGSSATLRSARSVLLSGGEISAGTTVLWSGYNNTSTYGVDMGGTVIYSGNTWIGGTSSSNGSLRWHGVMVGDGPVSGATPVRATGLWPSLNTRVNGDILIWAGNGSTRNGIYLDSSFTFGFTGEVTFLTPAISTALAASKLSVFSSAFNWSPASGTFGNAVWTGSGTGNSRASFEPSGVFNGVSLDLAYYGTAVRSLESVTIGRYTGMSYANGTTYVVGNSGNLSYNTSISNGFYIGNLSLNASNLTINTPIVQDANSTVTLSGNTTLSAQSITAGKLLLQDGSFNLSNVSNSVGTLAATNVTSLSYVNNGAISIGSAGGVDGITSTGAITVSTQTGDLAITQTVNTSSTGTGAIVLTAGATDAVNVITGGNITVSGSGALDTPGRSLLYTGGVTGSTGLTALIGSGSGNFRYNSTAASTGYTLALGSTGDYAIYRQKPVLTVTADTQNKVYGQFTGATISTTGVNGDTLSQIFGTTLPTTVISGAAYSTSGNLKYKATAYAVTVSGISTNQLGYANASYSNGTITITKAPLTVSGAVVADKVYNGNTNAVSSISGSTLTGVLANGSSNVSDVVTLALPTATFSGKNVGSNLTVTTGYTIASTDAANYQLTQPTLAGNITQATVTLSATQLYDGSTALTNVTVGTGVSGETLTYSGATANSSHVGAGNFINAITLGSQSGANATVGGLVSNYKLPTLNAANAPVTLTAVNLTLTATGNISRAYNGTTNMTIAASDFSVSGLLTGDSLSVANLSAAQYNNAHVASAANVTASNLTIAGITSTTLGSLAGDYSLQTSSLKWGTGGQSGTNANITPALVTLTATGNLSRVYDGTANITIATGNYSVSGLATGDSLTLANLSTALYNNAHVATASNVTVNNLTMATVTGNRTSVLGDYSLQTSSLVWGSGGQSGTNANITPVTLTVTGSLVTAKVYDGTTAATMTNGTLVGVLAGDVLALTQVGNFSSANVGGTAWGVTANDSVSVTSSNRSSVATDYSVTQPLGLTGNITKRTVTLSATQNYTAATALSNVTIGNLVGSQTLSYTSATANSSQVASNGANFITAITLTGGANGGSVGNYQLPTLNLANAPVTINKAPLGISANGTYKGSATYANLSGGTGLIQVNGTVGGETISAVTVTVANASVVANNYITSLTVVTGTANMNNYVLGGSYNATVGNTLNSFTMAKLNLSVTANSTSRQYGLGTTLGSTAFTSTGLLAGETLTGMTLTSTGSAATAAVATYNITPSAAVFGNGSAGNYNITYTNGTLTVTKAPLTLAASNISRAYGAANPTTDTVVITTGAVYNTDVLGNATVATTAAANLAAGSTANLTTSNVVFTSGLASNYNISYANGTLTIAKANLTITPNAKSTQYGLGSTLLGTAFTSSGLANGETIGSVTLTSTGSAATSAVGSYNITSASATGGTFNAANYNIAYANGTLTVTAAPLTLTAANLSRAYGAANPTTDTVAVTGTLYNGDALGNVTVSSTATNTAAAGSTSNLSGSAIVFTNGTASNYNITYANGTLTVAKANLTITANTRSTQYGLGTTMGTTAFTSSGLANAETIGGVVLASTGSAATANVGAYNITASGAGGGTFNTANYNISYANGTLNVTTAPLTLTVANLSRAYGAANPITDTAAVTGTLYNGNTVSSVSVSSAATGTTAAGSTANLSASAAVFGNGSASNYNITYVNGTLSITKAALGISASGVYSGSTSVAPTSYTLTGLANGETVSSITSLTVSNANVATANKTVTAIVVGNGSTASMSNYLLGASYNATANTSTTNAFTMAKAPLTVTADNAAVFVTQTVPGSYNVSYSGFVGGQTAGTAGLTTGTVSNSASNGSQAGGYVLTPSGWSASNYNISHVNGSFTVVPANQLMVQVASTSTTYGSAVAYASPTVQYMLGNSTLVTLTQTQQNGNTFTFADGSSGTVTFTLGAANASLSTGNKLAVGSYQVVGSNFSKTSNNFNGNITYSGSSSVSALGLTVNTGNVSKVYDGTDSMHGLTIGLSTVVAGDVVTVSGAGSFSQAGAGSNLSYNVSGLSLGGADAGNYFLSGGNSFSGSNGVISKAALTVTANNASTQYGLGTTLASTAFASAGLVNGETIGAVTLASTGSPATSNVGAYNITSSAATGGTFDINNYNVSYANGTLTVTPAPLTLSVNNQSRSYGAANPSTGAVTLTQGTLYNSDSLGASSLGSAANASSAVGNYTLTVSSQAFANGSAGNYNITYVDGTLAVTPASLTIVANNASASYGQGSVLGGTAFSSSGLQNGETIGTVTLTSTGSASTANVGVYNITAASAVGGSFTASNYNISYANGTLTVTPANLTISANSTSTQYGLGTTLGTTAFSSNGLQNGETIGAVTLASTGSAATANAGSYNITASAATGGSFDINNYNVSYANGTLTVTPAPLTVIATQQSRSYGAANPTAGAVTVTGGQLYNSDTLGTANLSSAATQTSAVGNYTLTASAQTFSAGSAGNYNITYADGTLAVTPASLTIAANNASKTYGQTLTFAGSEFTSSGLVNGETLSAVALSSTGAAATAPVNGGVAYAINAANATGANGFVASNYNISYANGSLTVNPAPLGISASGVYSGSTLVVPTDFSLTGLVNGETVQGVASVMLNNANVASANRVVSITLANGTADMANYVLSTSQNTAANTSTTNTFSMSKAPLTVQADNAAMFMGDTVPVAYNVSYRGFVNGESAITASGLSTGSMSNSAGSSPAAGSYTLSPSGWSADNYSLSYANGAFTVVAANQLMIQAGSNAGTYGSAASLAPLSVQYKSSGGPLVNLTLASSLGNNSYLYTDPYGGSVTFNLNAANASFSGSGNLKADSYQLTGTVSNVTGGNFNGTAVYTGALTVAPLTVQASTGQVSKVYDGSALMSGLVLGLNPVALSGDAVGVTGSGAFATRNVGNNLSYSVTGLALTGVDAANYVLSGGATSFSGNNGQIVAKTVTLTPQALSKVYDGSVVAVANLSQFSSQLGVAGDTVSAMALNFDDKNVGTGKTLAPSNAVISDGNGGNNYNIVYANASVGTVTRLSSVSWVGGVTGNWFDPANWAGGAVPDLSNVANVLIPSGVTVSFGSTVVAPAQSGAVNIDSLGGASGNLSQSAGTLNVGTGGITLGTLTQTGGNTTVAGNATVGNLSQANGTLSVNGSLTVNNNLSQTAGNTTVGGNTTVAGDAALAGNLSTGNLSANTTTISGGNTNVTGHSTTTGNLTIAGGNTSIGGNSTAGNLTVTGGNTTVTGNATVDNLSQGNGTLSVNGSLTVNNNLTQTAGSTTVGGNTTVVGNTSIGGNSTTGNLSSSNTTVSGGNTNVTGNSTTTGNLTITGGNTTIGGNSSAGNLTVTGGNTTVTGNSTTTGNLTITGGNTTVVGNSTSGNLTVSGGNVTTQGTLNTGNLSQSNGTVTSNGALTSSSYTQTGGSANVSGGLTVNGAFAQSGGSLGVTGNASITTTGSMQLGNLAVSGRLQAAASNGSITQTPATQVSVGQGASLQAPAGVSLNPGNQIQGGVQQSPQSGGNSAPEHHTVKVQGGTLLAPTLPTPQNERTYTPQMPQVQEAAPSNERVPSQGVVQEADRLLIVNNSDQSGD